MVAKDAGFVLGGPAPSTLLNSELSLVVDAPTIEPARRERWLSEQRKSPVFARHTNREPYRRDPLPDDLLRLLSSMQQDGACVRVFSKGAKQKRICTLIKLASEVRFRTRELHEWLYGSLRFPGDGQPDDEGLALETLGLPAGGGLLLKALSGWSTMSRLNQLKLYKLLALMETVHFLQAPALMAVLAPKLPETDFERPYFAAGRVMQRAWVAIEAAGFAAHPSYVITDQLDRLAAGKVPHALRGPVYALSREANALFGEGGHALCLLFRVGRPKKQAVRSRRRALEQMLHIPTEGESR
jgi:hypothetical protein